MVESSVETHAVRAAWGACTDSTPLSNMSCNRQSVPRCERRQHFSSIVCQPICHEVRLERGPRRMAYNQCTCTNVLLTPFRLLRAPDKLVIDQDVNPIELTAIAFESRSMSMLCLQTPTDSCTDIVPSKHFASHYQEFHGCQHHP